MNTKLCPNCHNSVDADNKFCPICGTNLTDISLQDVESQFQPNQSDLSTNYSSISNIMTSAKKKNKIPIVACIVTVIILAIVVLIFFIIRNNKFQNIVNQPNKGIDWENIKNSPQYSFQVITKEQGAFPVVHNGECILARYSGSDTTVKIPQTIDGHKLKCIGGGQDVEPSSENLLGMKFYSPFKNNKKIRAVYVPDGVTQLSSACFAGCTNLKEVCLPDSIDTVWSNAFDDCEEVEISFKDKTYTYNTIDDFYDLF